MSAKASSPSSATATLPIVASTKDYLVLNKPSMLHSVRLPRGGGSSLSDLLLAHDKSFEAVSDKPEDAGLLQRLDFETSGLIVAARTKAAWEALKKCLQSGAWEKKYLILVEGGFPKRASCDLAIGSPNRNAKKVRVFLQPRKRDRALPANSEFSLIAYDETKSLSLVEATAHSGRRHQIRAHAAQLGFPLLGDTLYGASGSLSDYAPKEGNAPPFILHAWKMAFLDPFTGNRVRYSLQAPEVLYQTPALAQLAQALPESDL